MNHDQIKYKMSYASGGGSECDGGEWEISIKPKTVIFRCTKKPFFYSLCPPEMKFGLKPGKHILKDWEDGTFTVYPYQSGIPHYFEPIEEAK
jgi:hypothetical protein